MSDMVEKFRKWSYHRQSLGKSASNIMQVLRDIICVYSSHPTAPLALYARVKAFREQDFFLLEESGQVFRIPAMRESVYMVPRENAYRLMSAALPPPSDPYWQKRYSQKGRFIPPDIYPAWKQEIFRLTQEPVTAGEIKGQSEIPAESLKAVLNRMAFAGELLRVGAKSLRSNIIQYVSSKYWADQNLAGDDADEAIIWLAGEYLRAFGPARIKDFQWWSGVSVNRARQALAAHDTEPLDDGYLILQDDIRRFENMEFPDQDHIDLLPQWDSYTMGYAPDGRERFVSLDMQEKLYGKLGATAGNALGAVIVKGLTHGIWSFRFKGNQMNITLDMFEKPSAHFQQDLGKACEQIAALLRAKKLNIDYA